MNRYSGQRSTHGRKPFAILTLEVNSDNVPFHEWRMAVRTRDQRLARPDGLLPEEEILRPLPQGMFRIKK
ncbi:hypothetical protein [Rhizobium leguminosarum]|uniref:Uncharacterized protein n=1 Tax=Rhizobium leguminosarum TaxID=384 RepID=A0A2Z4YS65_RHILE|nr:hypothetical protein [Rhizobium leguminosarum]AXA43033.1 hypothetical protein DLJ82_5472 [Rhizobium leguminosarum]